MITNQKAYRLGTKAKQREKAEAFSFLGWNFRYKTKETSIQIIETSEKSLAFLSLIK